MDFDPSTAQEVGFEYSFDPSSAKPEADFKFDPSTAEPAHDWGTTDARDAGVTNKGMSAPERKGAIGDRIGLVMQKGFASNPFTGRKDGSLEASYVKDMEEWFKKDPKSKTPEMQASVEAHKKQAIDKLAKYIALRQDIDADVQDANPSFVEEIVGGIIPSIPDPLNAVPIAKGAKVATTAFKSAVGGLGLGIVSAWEQGQYDKAIGLIKKDPEFSELLRSGFDTAMIVSAISTALHIRGNFHAGKYDGKPKVDTQLEAEAAKFVDAQRGAGKINPEAGIDTTDMVGPYSNTAGGGRTGLTKNQVLAINKLNEEAAAKGMDQVAGNREVSDIPDRAKNLTDPYWLDQELQAAIAKANKEAQVRENFGDEYPSDDLARGEPTQAEVVSDPLARQTPEQARQAMSDTLDYSNMTDSIDEQNPRSPYMTPEQQAEAQRWADKDKPGYGEMDVPKEAANIPYWRDEALEKAKSAANRVAGRRTGGPVDISRDGGGMPAAPIDSPILGKHQTRSAIDLNDPKNAAVVSKVETSLLETELKNTKSLSTAVESAIKYEKDPEIRDIASRLQTLVDKSTSIFVLNPDNVKAFGQDSAVKDLDKNSLGLHITLENTGRKSVVLRGTEYTKHGISPEVVFHEAGHNVSDHAFIIASDPALASKPEYKNHVQFAKDVNSLMEAVKSEYHIPKEFEAAFEKGGYEFNTYGWTNKAFRTWLSQVELTKYGKTALEKFKDFFRGLLGYKIDSVNGKAAVDKLLDALDSIKDYDKRDVGEVLSTNKSSSIKNPTSEPKTVQEAVEATTKDIRAERYIPMTVNQKALFLRNPVIKFAYDKLRQFTNEADVRFNLYKTYLSDVEQFIQKNRTESLKMLKVLADIQNPDLKDQRQVAQDTNTREAFLRDQGMDEKHIPMAIKILNVMQAVGMIDQANALKGMGHNWNLEPMYFPREHTGPFSVTVVDASGKVVYMKGFDDSKLAQQATTILKDKLKGTDHVVDIARHEPNTMGDLYNMLNINAPEKMPEFLKNITDGMLKEIEVAKRKFEMERSTDNIAGYTGETVYNSSNPLSGKYKQDTKLITLLQRRLEQSFQLETKARLLSELSEPLLSDPMTLIDLPNTRKMVKEMFAREMGLDISKLQVIMKDADRGVEAIGKIVNQIMAKAQGYEPHDISYFKPNEIARAIQAMVWTMSTFKLALSPATLLANTTTMFATPMSGVRTASKRNISQAVPLAAFLQTSTTMAGHFSPGLKDFLKDAQLEGMVEARVSDPLELTGAHTARGVVDKTLNTPRDVIEKATNFAGLAYYYNFFRLAYPDLDPKSRQFKTMVYEEVRSWTGDYSPQSQLLAISKGGAAGNLMSNFAKWKFNQLGRFWDDVRDLGEGKVAPIMVTTALSVLMAGMAGAPIAVTYEGLRRFGMMTGWWDWKPLSGFLYDLKDKGELGPHADWLIKGPLTQGADMVGKEFDLTMPDLSGNLKHASALDVNTMPFQFMADTAKLLSTGAKQAYKAANNAAGGSYPGATIQEQKEAVKGLPVVVGNVVRQFVEDRASDNSNITQYASEDVGQYPQNKQEKALAYLGLKSKAQNEYTDKDYTKKWVERYEKKQFGKYTDQMLANLNNPKVLEGLAEDIFELKGPAGIEAAIEKMKDVTFKRQTDVQTRETFEALQNKDTVAAIKALERLKSYRPSK